MATADPAPTGAWLTVPAERYTHDPGRVTVHATELDALRAAAATALARDDERLVAVLVGPGESVDDALAALYGPR